MAVCLYDTGTYPGVGVFKSLGSRSYLGSLGLQSTVRLPGCKRVEFVGWFGAVVEGFWLGLFMLKFLPAGVPLPAMDLKPGEAPDGVPLEGVPLEGVRGVGFLGVGAVESSSSSGLALGSSPLYTASNLRISSSSSASF